MRATEAGKCLSTSKFKWHLNSKQPVGNTDWCNSVLVMTASLLTWTVEEWMLFFIWLLKYWTNESRMMTVSEAGLCL